ncbi:MAG: tetraacyldisaccharide 4'-kinase [Gammaproteobacteria bacterium]|jgi:tetraacyldisaccharide 4'-kinase|nr:tetraacyldisaccharide 4'-kinase [Gammaproteobacteria bacterium]
MKRLDYYWYARSPWLVLLTPLSLLYGVIIRLRRSAYRCGLLRSIRIPRPVIVIGNITVGGTGKTPLVAWLAEYLRDKGYRPGIISRGYAGGASSWPQQVRPDSDPGVVGDEAVLLASKTHCPMAVAPDRVAAANALIEYSDCDVILSDDGLQHYALQRDIEIAVIDGVRRFGTGFLLPAGPLREPARRLQEVDLVVVNGLGGGREHPMQMQPGGAHNLLDADKVCPLSDFRSQKVHAVAAIGNPDRFFRSLQQAGLQLQTHIFPDHHPFQPDDIRFADGRAVLMTEKDAVKCRYFATANDWYVPVEARMTDDFCNCLDKLLDTRLSHHG